MRGKETKPATFGAKVNKLQVNGVSFIEHIIFDAFHEGNRLHSGIAMHECYFAKCHQLGANAIFGTNENKTFCTMQKIATCFTRKGKQPANGACSAPQSTMRSLLAKEKSTRLEGSFGNEK